MKRELKGLLQGASRSHAARYRKAHPDEKGTERLQVLQAAIEAEIIARPIPMKRELKEGMKPSQMKLHRNRKAHPDEKGTERAQVAYGKTRLRKLSQGPSR